MKINIALIVICQFIVILNCGCLESNESVTMIMTMEELIDSYNLSIDNDTKTYSYLLENLNDGDTLYIRDTLNTITYNEYNNYTLIYFESITSPPFTIDGDITGDFRVGDSIELRLHILYVNFTQQMNGETWIVKLETFQEGWNAENMTSTPIPQKYIRILEEENNVFTMTLAELMYDYDQKVDNSSKKIMTWFNSLNEGDTFILTDAVDNITYYDEYNVTLIAMKSSVNSSILPISIEGDISDNIMIDDDIEITLHLIKVTYVQQIYNETWTYEIETFKESWDSENNTSVPIPYKYISTR